MGMHQEYCESKQESQQVEIILPQPQVRCGNGCRRVTQVSGHDQATFRIQNDPGSECAILSPSTGNAAASSTGCRCLRKFNAAITSNRELQDRNASSRYCSFQSLTSSISHSSG